MKSCVFTSSLWYLDAEMKKVAIFRMKLALLIGLVAARPTDWKYVGESEVSENFNKSDSKTGSRTAKISFYFSVNVSLSF